MRAYAKVVALYPTSWLADDALYRIGVLYLRIGLNHSAFATFKKLLERYPNSDLRSMAKSHLYRLSHTTSKNIYKKKKNGRAYSVLFKGFRYWSNAKYTRVVLDFSDKIPFNFKIIKGSRETKLLILFAKPFYLHGASSRLIHGKDGEYFKEASLKGRTGTSPLAMITFGPNAQCRIFTLVSPFRVVIDAVHQRNNEKMCPVKPLHRKAENIIICLDPGHGGKDPGATGPHGIKEKNVVLRIARILRKILIKKYGFKVIMTRNSDVFIPLEERVAFANSHGADLFVSIHINASRNRHLQGIATYCLSNTSDRKSLRLAARENGVPLSKMSSVEKILNDMLFCEKYNESYQVAHIIQGELMREVRSYSPYIHNLGVRYAPFYVLAGAKMPSVLLELDFISNPKSEARLSHYPYLDTIADGIAKGISKTIKTTDVAENFN